MPQEKETSENLSSGPEKEGVERPKELEVEKPEVPKKPERPVEKPSIPEEVAPPPAGGPPAAALPIEQLKKIKKMPKPSQLKILVEVAFDKGIYQAIDLARSLESPYLLDEFHDALIDELRQRLIELGKLKEL